MNVICLLYEYKMSVELRNISVILTGDYKHTSKVSKYKISYHLLLCFLAANATRKFIQVNETANVFFMILRDCFIS